ncbi:hypothetical protein Thiowin_03225 [Thiorhodovibrio winogradskyi]|uniref:Uncharacterized protein n=1 Tax=Thiorhodovibrio winogradskyi TaxID=77007 RepID=A0ABZ0SDH3_9GAMM
MKNLGGADPDSGYTDPLFGSVSIHLVTNKTTHCSPTKGTKRAATRYDGAANAPDAGTNRSVSGLLTHPTTADQAAHQRKGNKADGESRYLFH